MRLYLAGTDTANHHLYLDGMKDLRFLVSYWYILNASGSEAIEYAVNNNIPVFLDSGAFSALMSGAFIDIDKYIRYCLDNKNKFEVIASLDVIGNWKGTLDNHKTMKESGVNSIPAFHVREPFEALRYFLETEEYIALGVAGMQRKQKQIMSWLAKCFELREEINPNCKFHGFALTSELTMRSFPWYSVDSTSWKSGWMYGRLTIRDGTRLLTYHKTDKQLLKYRDQVKDIIPNQGMDRDKVSRLLKHDAGAMIEWTQSLTQQRSKKYTTSQDTL